MKKLRRVDEPTTHIVGKIERYDASETGFSRADRGDYGPRAQTGRTHTYPLDRAIRSVRGGMPALRGGEPAMDLGPPPAYLLPDDLGALTRNVKSLGYFMGADVVGVCRIPEYAFYSHDASGDPVECAYENAVLIIVDQGYRTMKASSGRDWISSAQSHRGYTRTDFVAAIVAAYIRQLGHSARMNPQVVIPPLLMMAGVGEMARPAIVLNPFLGLRYKVAVVGTDMPLEADGPVDFGLQDFCKTCKKCAVECPAQAISHDDEKTVHNGYETYPFNAERCTRFRLTNPRGSMCGRCIKVCPWNKPDGWTHGLVRWMIQLMPLMNGIFIKMDDVLGYSQVNHDGKWWFDVEREGEGERDGPPRL